MTTMEYKPSDHILDEFLAKHGVYKAVDFTEFSALMAELRAAFMAETGAPAVHEAYVNAQRAVAALKWKGRDSSMYRLGQEHMQEDAVRAIREAAEEDR